MRICTDKIRIYLLVSLTMLGLLVPLSGQEIQKDYNFSFTLIYPFNKSTILESRPILSWESLHRSIPDVRDVKYNLLLVQLEGNQSPAVALNRNLPLVQEFGLNEARLLYPAVAPKLEEGSSYVWQVIATSNGSDLASSNIWVFTVGKPAENLKAAVTPATAYPMLSTAVSPRAYLFDQDIHIAFDNNEGATQLNYRIVELSNNNTEVVNLPIVSGLTDGLNLVVIPTASLVLIEDRTYQIEVFTERGQVYYLRFMTNSNL